MNQIKIISILSLFLFFISISLSLSGQTYWVGGVGEWHNPANWDSGQVPDGSDLVIIKNGEVVIVSGASASALAIFIDKESILTLESSAGLAVSNGHNGIGIDNDGRINVEGSLRISNIPGQNAIGLNNKGELNNAGTIGIQRVPVGYAIENDGEILNEGSMLLSECGAWCLINNETFENIGSLEIYDTSAHGLLAGSEGRIENLGEIAIDCPSQGFFNYGNFINATGAFLQINHPMGQGITGLLVGKAAYSPNPGSIENSGIIFIEGAQTNIYAGAGTFNNRGKITGINSTLAAIRVGFAGSFRNYAQIQIHSGIENGITNNGLFVNRRYGNLTLYDFQQIDIENNDTGEFRNFGSLGLADSGQKNIVNKGVFKNNGRGSLSINNEVETHQGSTFLNYGHIYNDFSGSHSIANGTFTNFAVLGDQTASFSNITNNGIHVLPIGPGLSIGQPTSNALGLGNLSGMTIGTWGTIMNWQSMGTYNSSANTFTPNSNAAGVVELVVEITINSVNKTGYHRIPVFGGIQSPGPSANPRDLSEDNNSNLDLQLFPNPAADILNVKLPASFDKERCTFDIISNEGKILHFEHRQIETSYSINVSKLSSGLYTLRITDGKQIMVRNFIKN